MKATVTDSAMLKPVVKILNSMLVGAVFKSGDKAGNITLSGTNESRIAYLKWVMRSEMFVEFEADKEERFGINMETFNKIIGLAGSGDVVNFKTADDMLHVTLAGSFKTNFRLGTEEPFDESHITDKAMFTISMESDTFEEAIKKAIVFGDEIKFSVDKSGFMISTNDDINEVKIPIPETDSIKYKFQEESGKAKYNSEILGKIIAANKLFEKVTIKFATDGCLDLNYKSDHATLQLVLAARVD